MRSPLGHILTINTGSSSLRARLYLANQDERPVRTAEVERIGQTGARLNVFEDDCCLLSEQPLDLPDHGTALRALLARLTEADGNGVAAISHRIVHGGRAFVEPRLVTDGVLAELWRLIPIAPSPPHGTAWITNAITSAASATP